MRERTSHLRLGVTVVCALIAFLCITMQKSSAEKKVWQAGTILEVKAHPSKSGDSYGPQKYDISLQVGRTIYVVLYAPKEEMPELEFYVGMARTVLVEDEFVTFNDLLGHTHPMRIVSSKHSPPESK